MWIGVSQAGYSFQDVLPILLVIFLLAAAAAITCEVEIPLTVGEV